MPPVSDLGRQRRARSGALGIAAAAVTADDLRARMGVQPGPERFRGPLRQHVHRPASLDVDQHGAVDVSLAQGKVIDAEHQRRPSVRVGRGADQPDQRRPADRAGQPPGQPRASAAAQGHGDGLQHAIQAAGPPAIANRQPRHLLGERHLRAGAAAAEEPASLQTDQYFLAAARGVGHLPLIAAVHPLRHHAAARARRLARAGPGPDMHRPARRLDMLDSQASQVRDQGGKDFKIARRA